MSLENPAYDLNDPRTYDLLTDGSQVAGSGVRVNENSAMGIAALWQGINRISGDVAKLPLNVEVNRGEYWEPYTRHPASNLVSKIASERLYLNAYDFWRRTLAEMLLYQNSYTYIRQNLLGEPQELIPLRPDVTQVNRTVSGDRYVSTWSEYFNATVNLDLSQVLWLEGLCWDGETAPPLVKTARESLGLSLSQQRYRSLFFRRGGRLGGALVIKSSTPKEAADRIEEGWRKSYESPEAAFRTAILRDDADFKTSMATPEQGQMTENQREQIREVARWLNIAPSKLGVDDGSSYSSKADDQRDYLDTTLSPHLKQIEEELNLKMLRRSSYLNDRYRFRFDTDQMEREGRGARYASHQVGLQGMFLTRNEVRRMEQLPPVPGGDEFVNPNTATETQDTAEEEVQNILLKCRRAARNSKHFLNWVDRDMMAAIERLPAAKQPRLELLRDSLVEVSNTTVAEDLPAAVQWEIDQCALSTTHSRPGCSPIRGSGSSLTVRNQTD